MSILDTLSKLCKIINDPFGTKGLSGASDLGTIDAKNKEVLKGFEELNNRLGKSAEQNAANIRNIQRLRKESSGL